MTKIRNRDKNSYLFFLYIQTKPAIKKGNNIKEKYFILEQFNFEMLKKYVIVQP